MASLLKWIQTPEAVRIAKVAEKKTWKTFLANRFRQRPHSNLRNLFQSRARPFDKRFWLRQQILEPGNETCAGC